MSSFKRMLQDAYDKGHAEHKDNVRRALIDLVGDPVVVTAITRYIQDRVVEQSKIMERYKVTTCVSSIAALPEVAGYFSRHCTTMRRQEAWDALRLFLTEYLGLPHEGNEYVLVDAS